MIHRLSEGGRRWTIHHLQYLYYKDGESFTALLKTNDSLFLEKISTLARYVAKKGLIFKYNFDRVILQIIKFQRVCCKKSPSTYRRTSVPLPTNSISSPVSTDGNPSDSLSRLFRLLQYSRDAKMTPAPISSFIRSLESHPASIWVAITRSHNSQRR